jgi:hypothetical protein
LFHFELWRLDKCFKTGIFFYISGTLCLTDLVEKVYSSILLDLFEGLELHAKRDGSESACKILKVIVTDNTKLYEVGWVGETVKIMQLSDNKQEELPIKYPTDDLLVKPEANDPARSKRPPLSTDFKVPIESVADLLMVWDFCLSFGRLLCLSPFSLSDLENAICYKESNLVLIVELHVALFHLLIKDEGAYFSFLQNKKRKQKVNFSSCMSF